jgi:hypothetical protein
VLPSPRPSPNFNRGILPDDHRPPPPPAHRGQLTPSLSAPPRSLSQHYINPAKLSDTSIGSLEHPTGAPMSSRRSSPPPPSVHRGTPASGPPQPQLFPPRASPPRPEAPRLLFYPSQPPEHLSRHSSPSPATLSPSSHRHSSPRPDSSHPQVRPDVVVLLHPSTLAAGDRRCRNRSVKPGFPSLTKAEDLGLEDTKVQGGF